MDGTAENTTTAALAVIACEAFRRGAPDEEQQFTIRSAWRDVGCSGSGPEAFRQFMFPGKSEFVWGARRLPALGVRASERRATEYEDSVPVGTIVATYSRDRYRGKGGRCTVTFGILIADGRKEAGFSVAELSHRTLRSKPVYEVTLPDGGKLEVPRRED